MYACMRGCMYACMYVCRYVCQPVVDRYVSLLAMGVSYELEITHTLMVEANDSWSAVAQR